MKRQVNKVHKRLASIVGLNRGKDKLPTPEKNPQKNKYATAKIKGVNWWGNMKKELLSEVYKDSRFFF